MSAEQPPPPTFDPEWLDRLRRSVDLRLDERGRWWHEGEAFEHPGLIRLFDRGLDAHPETGEAILRVGEKWCYVRAADGPFFVRRFQRAGGQLWAHLNTQAQVAVPPEAIFEVGPAPQRVRICLGGAPARWARLDRLAWHQLSDALTQDAQGALVIDTAEGRWPVRERSQDEAPPGSP